MNSFSSILAGLFLGLASVETHAQSDHYRLSQPVIDAGGGTSSGGKYWLTGAIGWANPPRSTGGQYSLAGGFQTIAAIQMPGAPRLAIRHSQNHVVLSWPVTTTAYRLQQTDRLDKPSWADVAAVPSNDGRIKSVTVPVVWPGPRFYRLAAQNP